MFAVCRFRNRPTVAFFLAFELLITWVSDSIVSAKPDVTLMFDFLDLLILQVRFRDKEPRDADRCYQQQDHLNSRLSSVQLGGGIDGMRVLRSTKRPYVRFPVAYV